MDKAQYACVQSSKLRYDILRDVLYGMGYAINDEDKCVFKRMASSNQITICVHVDELFMSCVDEKVMNSEIEKLKEIFGSLTVSCGKDRNIWEWCLILLRKEQVVIEM